MATQTLTPPLKLSAAPPDRAARDQRGLVAWIFLAAIAGFAALAAPMLLGQVYVADDLGEFHLPLRAFYSQQLERGEQFDWMPSLYGGFYLTGEGQLGSYHPLHQALYRWLPLGLAFDLELLLSYPLMFAGMFFLLARKLERRDAAAYGALVFTFAGFNLLHFVHPNAVAIAAHLPWLLYCVDVTLRSADRRYVAVAEVGVAVLVAMQLLLGYPQYVWLSLLVVAAYAACATASTPGNAWRLVVLAWSVLLGVLCAGIQLAPTYDLLAHSLRQSASSEFANSGSLHPLNLVQLVTPYAFRTRVVGQNTHELGLYFGAVPLVMCIWLAANRKHWGPWRPLVVALAVCGGLALMLACGQYGGLYRLQSLLPIVNRFRFPCRAIVLVQLCTAAASALALVLLLDRQRGKSTDSTSIRSAQSGQALGGTLVVSIGMAILAPLVWPEFVAPARLVWAGPLLVALAVGVVLLVERGVRWAPAALVLLTIADLSIYGMSYSVYGRTADLQQFVATTPRPPLRGQFRIAAVPANDALRTGDRVLLSGSTRVDGYAGLEPAKRLDYRDASALRLAGTQWLWQPSVRPENPRTQWQPLDATAPRVRIISRTAPAGALNDLAALQLAAAVTEPEVKLDITATGTATAIVDQPGLMRINVETSGRQLLATTESYHTGWRATAQGREMPVVRVNGDFLGCVLEPGMTQIELQFRPTSLRVGKILSWCGLGLIVFTLAVRLPLGKSRNCRDRQKCHAPRTTSY